MADWLLTIALLVAAVILIALARVGMIFFILLGSVPTALGLAALAEINGDDYGYVWTFSVGIAMIIAGYGFAAALARAAAQTTPKGRRLRTRERMSPVISDSRQRRAALTTVIVVAGCLAVYHLVVGGVPLFAWDIEVARFDFTSSGLFGIPGRMFLFGVPIAWAMATAAAYVAGRPLWEYPPWVLATVFFVLTSVLGGFKSGLVALATTGVLIATVIFGNQPRFTVVIRKYWWLGVASAAYAVLVASSYVSYQRADGTLLSLFMARATTVGAEPKRLALADESAMQLGSLSGDFWYFIRKYTGQSTGSDFTVERAVSALIIGADPSSSAWTTPVTLGGVPELVLFFGPAIAFAASFAIGVFIYRLYHLRYRSFSHIFVAAVTMVALSIWISRGGMAYYALNYLAVTALLGGIYWFASIVARSDPQLRRARRAGRHVHRADLSALVK